MIRIRKLLVRNWIVFTLMLTTGALLFIGCAQQKSDSNIADAYYDYPVKGGTEEWKSFTNLNEMLEACQISESILKKMSTAGLVETVLNYPLLGNMFAYNFPQQGFEAATAQFNGLKNF